MTMHYWLMKTEPETYSWEDLVRDTEEYGGEPWTGVRNYMARNYMRHMQVGDQVFIYHSGVVRAIVGIATVVALAHPDSTDTTGTWDCVNVAAVSALSRPIHLHEIKADTRFMDMMLVTHSRLSVQPVTNEAWHTILTL